VTRSVPALVVAGSVLALTLTACGADDAESDAASGAPPTSSSAAEEPTAEPGPGQPVGAGCSAVPAEGEGSFEGMTDDPVVTAASNTPVLSTLVEAVAAAHLADSLNGVEDVTVLAPANAAFEALPPEEYQALLADTPRLTAVLTHHVLEGRLAPGDLVGEHTTLAGDTVTIEGSGEEFSVAAVGTVRGQAPANVVCGNLQTANATVYVIDQVLAPPAA
jgi:uncharacterized surface protein with fasciclin (FAS1) repeats